MVSLDAAISFCCRSSPPLLSPPQPQLPPIPLPRLHHRHHRNNNQHAVTTCLSSKSQYQNAIVLKRGNCLKNSSLSNTTTARSRIRLTTQPSTRGKESEVETVAQKPEEPEEENDILQKLKDLAGMSAPPQKAAPPPQILRVDKAFKLAEQWVNNMSKGVEDEPAQVESEGRHPRLGLGARVLRSWNFTSNDLVARKLHAKLEAGKKKTARNGEDPIPSARGGGDDDEDSSEDESESRSSLHDKKRVGPPHSAAQVKKKQKQTCSLCRDYML